MDCERFESWLAAGGDLPEDLRRHARACPECAEHQEIDALLRRQVPTVEPSPALDADLLNRVRARASRSLRGWLRVGAYGAACALFVTSFIGLIVISRPPRPQAPTTGGTGTKAPPAMPPGVTQSTVAITLAPSSSRFPFVEVRPPSKPVEVFSGRRVRAVDRVSSLAAFATQVLPTWPSVTPVRLSMASDAHCSDLVPVLQTLQRAGMTDLGFSLRRPPLSGAPTPGTMVSLPWGYCGPDFSHAFVRVEHAKQGYQFRIQTVMDSVQGLPDLGTKSFGYRCDGPAPVVFLDLGGENLPAQALTQVIESLAAQQFDDVRLLCPRPSQPIHVYAADDAPRWEWRYLKSLLARDEDVRLDEHLDSADTEFPQAPSIEGRPLDSYDVIVLGDVAVSAGCATALKRWVEGGGGLVLISGPKRMPAALRGTALEGILPCDVPAQVGWATLDRPAKLTFSAEGIALFDGPSTPIPPGAPAWWSGDGATGYLPLLPAANARALATIEGAGARPAFLLRAWGKGQVFLSTLDETWRWRSASTAAYASFWKTVVRLVARRTEPLPVWLVQGASPSKFLAEAMRVEAEAGDGPAVEVSTSKEPPADLVAPGALLLDGVPPTPAQRAFVEAGGTMVVVAGEAIANDANCLRDLLGARVAGWRDVPQGVQAQVTPIAPLISTSLLGMLRDVKVHRALRLEGAEGDVILDADGPVIVDRAVGKGHVVLVASPLDGEAIDLPARPAFVVLLDRLLGRAAK